MSSLSSGIGQYTLYFNAITSTHDWLFERAEEPDFPNGMYITAGEQSAGRGQKENFWHANAGQNLLFSLLLKDLELEPKNAWLLNAMAALAIMDLFEYYSILDGMIKWPNDIYLGKKKVAGVLIRNGVGKHKIKHSVVSVGLNVNQSEFPNYLPFATSMAHSAGGEFDLLELKWLFVSYIAARRDQLESSPDHIRGSFIKKLYGHKRHVPLMIDGHRRKASIADLGDDGNFVLVFEGVKDVQTIEQQRIKFIIEHA